MVQLPMAYRLGVKLATISNMTGRNSALSRHHFRPGLHSSIEVRTEPSYPTWMRVLSTGCVLVSDIHFSKKGHNIIMFLILRNFCSGMFPNMLVEFKFRH